MVVAPPIALELAKQPVEKEFDLSSLKVLRSGSGAVSKETIQILQEKLGVFYFQSYGMTENTMLSHSNSIGYNKDGSVGLVLPFFEAKVLFNFINLVDKIKFKISIFLLGGRFGDWPGTWPE